MRYWFDTEFMEDGHTIELLSIGIVSDDGREFYAESAEANLDHANDWVKKNVLPLLHTKTVDIGSGYIAERPDIEHPAVMSRSAIAESLITFARPREGLRIDQDPPQFWAYYADYDWVVLCQLFGTMIDLPLFWPMFCMDVKQLAVSVGDPKLPKQESIEHHALNDARWTKVAYDFLKARGA